MLLDSLLRGLLWVNTGKSGKRGSKEIIEEQDLHV
jgi:hypothetical protein